MPRQRDDVVQLEYPARARSQRSSDCGAKSSEPAWSEIAQATHAPSCIVLQTFVSGCQKHMNGGAMHTHTACACLLKVSGFRERRDRRRGCQLARSFVRGFRKIVRGRLSSRALRLCFIKGTYGQVARDTWHVTTNGLQLYMLLSFYSIVLVEKILKK